MPHNRNDALYSILIAENHYELRSALAGVFSREIYEVVVVADGNDALSKSISQDFDLVITDIELPVLDGIELLCELRRQKPNLPVMVVGLKENETSASWDKLLGAAATFMHPVDPLTLLSVTQAVLLQSRNLIPTKRFS